MPEVLADRQAGDWYAAAPLVMGAIMYRATGPGRCEIVAEGVGAMEALLYNFDFDDFAGLRYREVKPEHKVFLTEKVFPLLRGDRGNIWLEGAASKIGASSWNMELSQTRVGRVANHLSTLGIVPEQMQLAAIGETKAQRHSEDDPRDRSVKLWVLPKPPALHPEPLPRVVPKKTSFLSSHFKITMVSALSFSQAVNAGKFMKLPRISGGIAIDGIFFVIWDTENNVAMLYFYFGIGLGAGFALSPPASATQHGPWTPFTTEKPMACWQFGPGARFTTAGAGSKSVNWITMDTPPGIADINSLSIATGFTYGASMSFSVLSELFRVGLPYHFFGP